jgi:predicted nucleic acid-binding protein
MELNAELLLIDERTGRAIARQNGIPIIGVLGVLLEAKRQGLIGAVKPPLDQLINQVEFWVDKQLYDAVIKFAGEK